MFVKAHHQLKDKRTGDSVSVRDWLDGVGGGCLNLVNLVVSLNFSFQVLIDADLCLMHSNP